MFRINFDNTAVTNAITVTAIMWLLFDYSIGLTNIDHAVSKKMTVLFCFGRLNILSATRIEQLRV